MQGRIVKEFDEIRKKEEARLANMTEEEADFETAEDEARAEAMDLDESSNDDMDELEMDDDDDLEFDLDDFGSDILSKLKPKLKTTRWGILSDTTYLAQRKVIQRLVRLAIAAKIPWKGVVESGPLPLLLLFLFLLIQHEPYGTVIDDALPKSKMMQGRGNRMSSIKNLLSQVSSIHTHLGLKNPALDPRIRALYKLWLRHDDKTYPNKVGWRMSAWRVAFAQLCGGTNPDVRGVAKYCIILDATCTGRRIMQLLHGWIGMFLIPPNFRLKDWVGKVSLNLNEALEGEWLGPEVLYFVDKPFKTDDSSRVKAIYSSPEPSLNLLMLKLWLWKQNMADGYVLHETNWEYVGYERRRDINGRRKPINGHHMRYSVLHTECAGMRKEVNLINEVLGLDGEADSSGGAHDMRGTRVNWESSSGVNPAQTRASFDWKSTAVQNQYTQSSLDEEKRIADSLTSAKPAPYRTYPSCKAKPFAVASAPNTARSFGPSCPRPICRSLYCTFAQRCRNRAAVKGNPYKLI